uniref:NADH-ubiquinone oxidoreductase chain 4 n=1 Tax=Oryzaephilus surinamensis TaxID=41112 RepID=A0A8A6NL31_ORYSU|nr:NADH dehydrogenase subunit 4 [Oryzaephilus surinamensis]
MMSLIMYLVFMMPLCLILDYWLVQLMFINVMFIFMKYINFSDFYFHISYELGVDYYSMFLLLLSFWICSLMILASFKIYMMNNYFNLFLFTILILMFSLIMTFSSMNMFLFYLFFEVSLVPTLFLIIGWGYQPERLLAGVYMFFYTLLVSLPMMISIFNLFTILNSLDFYFMIFSFGKYMFFCMNLVFMVKLPLYFLHLWLPKAHVEAPVSGSMILAGVMLKLGGYGMLRVMPLFVGVLLEIGDLLIVISLFGGLVVSFICIRQSDIKSLIAYSSVAHMSLVSSGIFTLSNSGLVGSLTMMLAHGLCSSGLFCLANIVYERLHSRSIFLNKGLMVFFPSLSLWWFLFSSFNMAAPPSLNLISEILLMNSIVGKSSLYLFMLGVISFMSAVYSLYLYSYSQHGIGFSGGMIFSLINIREYLLLYLHFFPLLGLVLKLDLI